MGIARELPNVLIISCLYFLLVLFAEIVTRKFKPHPETSRKLVHVGGGFVCLLFPYLLSSHLIVLFMAICMSFFFKLGEKLNFLKCLNQVGRTTQGSAYYPLAIWLVFYLTPGAPAFFIASILVLAVADAGAALFGSQYGRILYSIDHEKKSLEGSLIFLLLAFLSIFIPLESLTSLPLVQTFLVSSLIAAIVTIVEAISRDGRDNIFVPLAVCLLLGKLTNKPIPEVIYQLFSFYLLLFVVGNFLRKSKCFNTGGSLAYCLFYYATWSLGSEAWTLPLIISQGICLYLGKDNLSSNKVFRVKESLEQLYIPTSILIIANITNIYDFLFGPYLVAVTLSFYLLVLKKDNESKSISYQDHLKILGSVAFYMLLQLAGIPQWKIPHESIMMVLLGS